MRVTIYQNLSEPNVVNKDLREIATLEGTLRSETSVMNPVITLAVADADIVWCNYIYIAEWGRYYFVNEIESIRDDFWAVSCHVDVLTTYRNNIMPLYAIVARQENLYNLYLDDDKFLVNAPRRVVTRAFPNRVTPASDGLSLLLTIGGARQV